MTIRTKPANTQISYKLLIENLLEIGDVHTIFIHPNNIADLLTWLRVSNLYDGPLGDLKISDARVDWNMGIPPNTVVFASNTEWLMLEGVMFTPPSQHLKENRMDKPTIGRIVIYNHPGSADGKYKPTQSPAIIQAVAEDGTVRLFVFGPKGQHMDDGLTQGDGPCQWNWPVRA